MTKAILSLATIAALALAPLAPTTSLAAEAGVGYGGTTGALSLETRGLPTDASQVRSQGGFATAGAVQWIKAPGASAQVKAAAF